jgi:inorganic triphosphatase YgiF
MSALGNYIHYYKRNYFSYGTDPTMGSRGYNRTDIVQAIEQKRQTMSLAFHIKQRDKFKAQYQEALNYLHGEMKKSSETLEKETDNAVIAEFQKIVKENFPGVIMDFASMSAMRVPEEIDRMKKIKSSQTKNLSFNSLNKKLQHLYSLFQERGNDLKDRYSQDEIDVKYQLYKKVVNAVNNFYKAHDCIFVPRRERMVMMSFLI